MLPAGAACDGVHHTRYQRSSKAELAVYTKVAERLKLTTEYVRSVASGIRRSEAITAAIEDEIKRTQKAGRSQ